MPTTTQRSLVADLGLLVRVLRDATTDLASGSRRIRRRLAPPWREGRRYWRLVKKRVRSRLG